MKNSLFNLEEKKNKKNHTASIICTFSLTLYESHTSGILEWVRVISSHAQ